MMTLEKNEILRLRFTTLENDNMDRFTKKDSQKSNTLSFRLSTISKATSFGEAFSFFHFFVLI